MGQQKSRAAQGMPVVNVADVRARYDPELPNASAVLAALSCVSAQYANRPSVELAILASDLAVQLQAPEYAESQLVRDVAVQLTWQWDGIVDAHHDALLSEPSNSNACH